MHTVWRQYGGWWDGNPATLKPAPERALALELAALAGGAEGAGRAGPPAPGGRGGRARVRGRRGPTGPSAWPATSPSTRGWPSPTTTPCSGRASRSSRRGPRGHLDHGTRRLHLGLQRVGRRGRATRTERPATRTDAGRTASTRRQVLSRRGLRWHRANSSFRAGFDSVSAVDSSLTSASPDTPETPGQSPKKSPPPAGRGRGRSWSALLLTGCQLPTFGGLQGRHHAGPLHVPALAGLLHRRPDRRAASSSCSSSGPSFRYRRRSDDDARADPVPHAASRSSTR